MGLFLFVGTLDGALKVRTIAKTMKLQEKCPTCGKVAIANGTANLFGTIYTTFECGHMAPTATLGLEGSEGTPGDSDAASATVEAASLPLWAHALDTSGHTLRHYQIEGNTFLDDSQNERRKIGVGQFCALLADDMGIGKTAQACSVLRKHDELFPVLILAKGATMSNWAQELEKWTAPITQRPTIFCLNQNLVVPGMDIYIMSHDMLGAGQRVGALKEGKKKQLSVVDRLLRCGIKTIIVDEAQGFKDPGSLRTRSLITLITLAEIKNRIFLSGTPIKSRASEYFTILNLLDPRNFNSLASFKQRWLMANEKGVYTKLQPWRVEEFREMTKPYILRRTRDEVLKDLPAFSLNHQYLTITDPSFIARYNREADLFANFMNSGEKMNSTQILGWLARMRRAAGEAKITPYLEELCDWLESTEREEGPSPKITVGIHHESVVTSLQMLLQRRGIKAMTLTGKDDNMAKGRIIENFKNDASARVLIVNALAGGVGLNIQFCWNAVLLERQWTPSDESQFWGRFHRSGQTNPVTGTIFSARGTIDQFFHELLEEKTRILGETLDGWSPESDEGFLQDLAERVSVGRI